MNILLLGGSKSGKSTLAQQLTRTLAQGGEMIYWATMEPSDSEDRTRIAHHLDARAGWGFQTVERGHNLLQAPVGSGWSILLDSVTALLANEMFLGGMLHPDAPQRVLAELTALSQTARHLVCVCDDVFSDGMRYDPGTVSYCQGLAQVCRGLAGQFDTVCQVTAGVPKIWKGALPREDIR